MKILITGGAGFVGSNLAEQVLKRGEQLYIIDNLYRVGGKDNINLLRKIGDFKFEKIDVRDSESVDKFVKEVQPDVIFHLAGQVAMTTSIENPREDFEINTLGTINILEAVRKYSKDTIITYSSSNKVYGDLEYINYYEEDKRYVAIDHKNGFDERMPLDFHSPYGCSKGAAEQYMLDYARIYKLKTIVFRHSTMYGVHQFATEDQGWIGWFCKKAIETKKGILKEPFTICGNGKQVRDVLYVEDVVNCYFKATENIEKTAGNVFNIGGGIENSLSLLELFCILEEKCNIKMKYNKINWRESDQKVFVADNTKIISYTNWEPKVTSEEGIRRMLEWTERL